MKKGKKSKMTLTVILMLAVMFVGTTVVAAAGATITWDPNPIIAGGDTTRSVVFNPPEEMVFFNDEYVPVYEDDNTTIKEWQQVRATFTRSLTELRDMYATDPGADPSFVWEYPNPTYPGNTLTFKNDNKDPDDPFAGKTYFLVPQPSFDMSLKVRYYLPMPSAWNTDDPNPTDPTALGPNPGRSNFVAFNYGGPFDEKGVVTQVSVDKGQPILSGTWPQTYGKEVNQIVMNELVMKAGDADIPAEQHEYTWGNVVWNRENGVYVYAAKSVAGEGTGSQYEVPVDVTVYVKDGDTRIDLGTKTFEPKVINDINGHSTSSSVAPTVTYDLPIIPYNAKGSDGQPNLSKLKPGVYKLLVDTAANMNNEATQGQEIGTLTVAGVSKVTVTPGAEIAPKGSASTRQFDANVEVVEDADHPVGDKGVTWKVDGQTSTGTSIDPNGKLTIAANEAADLLVVTATSKFDNSGQGSVTGMATVDLLGVSGVTVSPASSTVEKGAKQKFSADVAVDDRASKDVTWKVAGGSDSSIAADGTLSVGMNEKAGTELTVTATSAFDPSKEGTAKVTVKEPDHTPTGGKTEIKKGEDAQFGFPGLYANFKALYMKGADGTRTEFIPVPQSNTFAYLNYPGYSKGYAGEMHDGSVDVTLYAAFLDTLPGGTYTLEMEFSDGGVQNVGSTQFTLVREGDPTPTATAAPTATPTAKTTGPKTNDETNILPWIVLAVVAGAAIIWLVYRSRKAKKAGSQK